MSRIVQRSLAVLCALAAGTGLVPMTVAATGEPLLTAGVDATVALPASGCAMKVCLPDNYDADHKWPVVFFYPGVGGAPDTTLMRRFTEGRDYIVVGLPYVATDDHPQSPQAQAAGLKSELAGFRDARAWVTAHASVDETRVFLAGASKGGWTASSLGELELPRLGGLIILLAGRPSGPVLATAGLRNMPIYIGAGETDPNLLPARRAREVYKRNGALVTLEEYAGHGHEVPLDAVRLRAWLQVQGRYHEEAAAQRPQEEMTAQVNGIFNSVTAETNALAQYVQLLALAEDPRLRLCDPAVLRQLSTRFASLIQASPARDEWGAEKTFSDLLYREACIQRLADLKAVLDGFQGLTRDFPQTRCGRLAAQYLPHLAEAYQKSAEATRRAQESQPTKPANTVTPAFPMSGSRESIPVPVREGNKIRFK